MRTNCRFFVLSLVLAIALYVESTLPHHYIEDEERTKREINGENAIHERFSREALTLRPDDALKALPQKLIETTRAPLSTSRPVTLPPTTKSPSNPSDKNEVPISSAEANKGVNNSAAAFEKKAAFEKELQSNGFVITKQETPEFGHLQFFKTKPKTMEIANVAFRQEFASLSVKESLKLTPVQAVLSLPKAKINPLSGCPPIASCTLLDNFYRRHDGACNNLVNPNWGRALTPFERMNLPNYADGVSSPRKSMPSGAELPSARTLSAAIAQDIDKPSLKFTLSVMQWGQFIDHDLTHSSVSRYGGSTGIECCGSNGPLPATQSHPECLPITISASDPFYSLFGRRCMNFVRSLPAPNPNCNTLGFRNQINQITHYLDGSAVYGSSDEESNNLRQTTGGLLKVQSGNFLPEDTSTISLDFLAGDSRVNEQPHLSVIHTIWMREHNRVATKLAQLHSTWSHDTIYQEARKIIVAEIQHIVYNEWLPIILGTNAVTNFDLLPKTSGFTDTYSEFEHPGIFNEFSTVAFRFGHTLIQGTLRLYDNTDVNTENVELSDNFNKPSILTTPLPKFDNLVRSLYNQPMQDFDNCVVDDVTNKLFKPNTQSDGLDLVALNIQRGRDHGIETYKKIREKCGLFGPNSFSNLNTYMKPSVVAALQSNYLTVQDIDAFIAGISEPQFEGGIVGATFNCIIRRQFANLKYGDRFFYENGGMLSSFPEVQLNEIRKTSWARIICDNDPNIPSIQPSAFRLQDSVNIKTACSNTASIPTVDLTKW